RRVRVDPEDLHHPGRPPHRGLRHRPFRLGLPPAFLAFRAPTAHCSATVRFAVVAQRSTPTNLALASCAVPGVEGVLLTPAQALARLGPGDVALGRLDVLHSLDGVEPGAWAFDALEENGCRLLNRRRSIFAAHD